MHCRSHLVVSTFVALTIAVAPARGAIAAPAPSTSAAATTETPETPETLSAEAVSAFKAGEFDKAIDLFQRAYTLDPQPNYLFNIGRVYEEKGDLDKAVANYQEFVQQPGVDIEAREAATARLKVLQQTLAQLREDSEPKTGPKPQVVEPSPADQAAAARKRKLRIAGYSLLGVGGGVLVIGAVFGGLAVGKSNDAKDAAFVDERLSLRQEAKGRAVVGDGLMLTGGVLAVVGLGLLLAGVIKVRGKSNADKASANARSNRGRSMTWQPVVAPGGASNRSWNAGLSLAGSF